MIDSAAPLLLDTSALIRFAAGSEEMGRTTRKLIDDARVEGRAQVATISFWEIAMLERKKRAVVSVAPPDFLAQTLARGFLTRDLDATDALAAGALDWEHGDPADRIIAATAISLGATLVTMDYKLLELRMRHLRTHDARR